MTTILHVSETILGGVGTYIEAFAECSPEGTTSFFLVPEQHRHKLTTDQNVFTFDRPSRGIAANIKLVRNLKRLVAQLQPDILYFHSTFSLFAMASCQVFFKGRVMYCPHSWAQLRYSHNPFLFQTTKFVESLLCKAADDVICVSKNDYAIAETSGYRGRIHLIENALPHLGTPPQARELGTDRINIVFVGRFDRQKGLDLLLSSFMDVISQRDDLALHIVGAPVEDRPKDRQYDSDQILYYGWQSSQSVTEILASADAVILPSRWEGLPMVLIESLRVGTPVLLSKVSGMGALIDNGAHGYSFNLSEEDLSQCLLKLEKTDLARMRDSSRKLFQTRYSEARFKRDIGNLLSHKA